MPAPGLARKPARKAHAGARQVREVLCLVAARTQYYASSDSFALQAQVLLDKWAASGGDTSATRSSRRSVDVSPSDDRIRTEVFDASAPTP